MNNRTAGDNKITALYERLSRDDELAGDSSIANQKKMLEDYAKNNGYANTVHFTDDGFSGGNFDRPGWKQMLSQIENGSIGTVIAKDDCVIIELNAESPIKCGFCAVSSIF